MIEPTNRNIRTYQNDIVPAKKNAKTYSRNQEETVLVYGVVMFCCPLTWSYHGLWGDPSFGSADQHGVVMPPLPGQILEGHLTHLSF